MTLTPTCLCLVLSESQPGRQEILLGRKQLGLGAGKVVAPGGHVEEGEAARQAAAREVHEETGLLVDPEALRDVAEVTFLFPAKPSWNQSVSVFMAAGWGGEVQASDEILPFWASVDALPLDDMWDDARFWLPRALAGERFDATFTFADDCESVADSDVRVR